MAGGSATIWIDRAAALCHRLRYSARARYAGLFLFVAAAALTIFARPSQMLDMSVSSLVVGAVDAAQAGAYVRVRGLLRPDQALRSSLRLDLIPVTGGFLILVDPTSGAYLWVRDDDSLGRGENVPTFLVGRIERGQGAEPEIYMRVERPPLVIAAEWLMRIGVLGLVLVVGAAVLVFVAGRLQFALPSLWAPSAENAEPAGAFLYGGLGYAHGEVQLRAALVTVQLAVHEMRLVPAGATGNWSIHVRRVLRIDLYDVASSDGPRAGARMHYEDERGLLRTMVLAVSGRAERAVLMQMASNLRV